MSEGTLAFWADMIINDVECDGTPEKIIERLIAFENRAKEPVSEEQMMKLHNAIVKQWIKDFGSLDQNQYFNAYGISGFIYHILKNNPEILK